MFDGRTVPDADLTPMTARQQGILGESYERQWLLMKLVLAQGGQKTHIRATRRRLDAVSNLDDLIQCIHAVLVLLHPQFPQAHLRVLACRRQAIGLHVGRRACHHRSFWADEPIVKGDCTHERIVPFPPHHRGAFHYAVDGDCVVFPPCSDVLPIIAPRAAEEGSVEGAEAIQELPTFQIPDAEHPIPTSGRQCLPIRREAQRVNGGRTHLHAIHVIGLFHRPSPTVASESHEGPFALVVLESVSQAAATFLEQVQATVLMAHHEGSVSFGRPRHIHASVFQSRWTVLCHEMNPSHQFGRACFFPLFFQQKHKHVSSGSAHHHVACRCTWSMIVTRRRTVRHQQDLLDLGFFLATSAASRRALQDETVADVVDQPAASTRRTRRTMRRKAHETAPPLPTHPIASFWRVPFVHGSKTQCRFRTSKAR
mmetsp:Transcript_7239/g.45235  ORF Transcript_7239/g.45235 Transcript_7239/m.45235 type:complete len:426 (-) Transcript_7239:3061-4338(-)